jgi:hypothetical protein
LHVSAGDELLNFGQNFAAIFSKVFDALSLDDDRHHLKSIDQNLTDTTRDNNLAGFNI